MDRIKFYCPGCDRQLAVPGSAEGKKIRCPGCGETARVPGETAGLPRRSRPRPRDQIAAGDRSDRDTVYDEYTDDYQEPEKEPRPRRPRLRPAMQRDHDVLTPLDIIAAIFCSGPALFLGVIRICTGKPRSGAAIIGIAIALQIVWLILIFIIVMVNQ